MPRASPILTQFNAGELSPLMEGRVDLDFYANGCRAMLNMIPTVQGPAKRRPGTRFVAAATSEDEYYSLYVPFVASVGAVYLLGFESNAIVIYADDTDATREALENIGTVTGTVPWYISHLYNADGSVALSFVQSGDVMYVAHPDFPVQKITRTSPTAFSIAPAAFTGGPWKEANDTESTTVYASAATGSVTLQASADIFTAAHVGSLFRIEQADLSTVKPWEPGQKDNGGMLAVNSLRRSDGKTYKATTVSAGTAPTGGVTLKYTQTGSVKPIHTKGKAWDGDRTTTLFPGTTDWYSTGVEWEYQDPGFGIFLITAFTDANTVTATVVGLAPAAIVGSGNASWRWEFGAWSEAEGYPEFVTFFRERLVAARGIHLWASVAGDFENFHDREFSEPAADSAVTIDVIKDQANAISWLSADDDGLLVGTTGCEFAVQPATQSEPFGPANVRVDRQSDYGGIAVAPIKVGEATLFLQRGGRKLREMTFSFDSEQYIAADLTIRAEHITRGGIIGMAYAPEPDAIVWMVRADGALIGFTYNREQEVIAWHRHDVGGEVLQVLTTPNQAQGREILWLLVRRTVDGDPVLRIEALSRGHVHDEDQASAFYVDGGITTVPVDGGDGYFYAILGAEFPVGEDVTILLDGAVHPARTVVDAPGVLDFGVQLMREGDVAHVGYHNPAYLETMRLEAGSADGTSQGKIGRVTEASVRFLDTLGCKAGPSGSTLDRIEFRGGSTPMDQPPPLFTGDKRVPWPSGYETERRLYFLQDQPLPMTIVAVMPQVIAQDKG